MSEALNVTQKDAIDLEKIQRLSAFWRLAKKDRAEQLVTLPGSFKKMAIK